MSDSADTPDSVPGDTPIGQGVRTPSGTPDPHGVKTADEGSPAEKDSANWVTGAEPMTGPQASYLETLAQQAGEEAPTELTKAQASDEIERLQGAADADNARQERPTDSWVTGDEPMTGPQASYLETLAQQAGEAPPADLTKSQASRAIDELQKKVGSSVGRNE